MKDFSAIKVTNIEWETDGEAVDLPKEMDVPSYIDADCFADYLSDQTGWLVKSFDIED
jgi:hypothetical protein